ncbi:MAG: stage 0 sporulation protein [Clostridiales bacterium]|nr:stage 0 sporulation protein [Clostridiales bacterium]MBR4947950.1 stage 0 sporulation protein [Clostridiales bacterium]
MKIVNLRTRDAGVTLRYRCDGLSLALGDAVMIDTELCEEIAFVAQEPYVEETAEDIPFVKRMASEKELEKYYDICAKEKEAFFKCKELIAARGIEMNLVDCEYSFDGKKLTFYFTADGRVDFRELVKDLAYAFRTRIELRQIGSRDQAKLVGGIGMCGRELCCCSFLNHFAPVNLKLARSQGLSLNPGKLNGACGRLMCCLQFEKEAYEDAHRRLPDLGSRVRTPVGVGVVTDVNFIEETLNVKFVTENDTEIEKFSWSDIEDLNHDMVKRNPGNGKGGNKNDDSYADSDLEDDGES